MGWILLGVALILGLSVVVVSNGLAKARNHILSAWAPELRADQGFLALQEELSGIEGRIAFARQFFNDTVLRYNTKIESFPSMLVARPLRLRAREYFEADPTLQGPVQVDL